MNLFKLPNPDELKCYVWSYTNTHGRLVLRVNSEKNTLAWLVFTSVSYFSAPIRWQGANFEIATPEELEQFNQTIHRAEMEKTIPNDIKKHNLYTVSARYMWGDLAAFKVLILAYTHGMTDKFR